MKILALLLILSGLAACTTHTIRLNWALPKLLAQAVR